MQLLSLECGDIFDGGIPRQAAYFLPSLLVSKALGMFPYLCGSVISCYPTSQPFKNMA
jgi:hypothetical protein